MTLCPGMKEDGSPERAWNRELDQDLAAIKAWGATALVTLIEDYDFEVLSVSELPLKVQATGLEWHHLPIMNRDVPSSAFEAKWIVSGERIRVRLRNGERIVLHCKNGLGRAGMIAARLLVEFGEPPDTAIRRVRMARPGAIETELQEQHIFDVRKWN